MIIALCFLFPWFQDVFLQTRPFPFKTLHFTGSLSSLQFFRVLIRASDISRKKTQNFAGFSGANSRKNRRISRDFRGKKVKTCGKIGRFRRIFAGKSQNSRKNPPISREKSQNSQENRPISRHFSGKSQISKDFQGQIHRKIGRFHGETSPRNNQ